LLSDSCKDDQKKKCLIGNSKEVYDNQPDLTIKCDIPDDTYTESERFFPEWNWDEIYSYGPQIQRLPWFTNDLDSDLREELNCRNIRGGKFLDIGTGPATQAIQLSKLGFEVTATDISQRAIMRARSLSQDVKFIADDILDSRLSKDGYLFDYIFDRGCFHTLNPKYRSQYVTQVKKLMARRALFFLKTFSSKQPPGPGPYRFSVDTIREYFSKELMLLCSKETIYEGTFRVLPRALFVVMTRND